MVRSSEITPASSLVPPASTPITGPGDMGGRYTAQPHVRLQPRRAAAVQRLPIAQAPARPRRLEPARVVPAAAREGAEGTGRAEARGDHAAPRGQVDRAGNRGVDPRLDR